VGLDREEQFFAFVNAHQDRAVRVAWRLVGGNDAAAEDIAQDAFLKAYRGLSRFREESSLATWFYRILVNEARKYRRWHAIRDRWNELLVRDVPDSTSAATSDPMLRGRIREALERLPRGQREVFVLVHLEGFTIEQAAAQLGKARGTVKSHLHRGLQKLRVDLKDLCDSNLEER